VSSCRPECVGSCSALLHFLTARAIRWANRSKSDAVVKSRISKTPSLSALATRAGRVLLADEAAPSLLSAICGSVIVCASMLHKQP